MAQFKVEWTEELWQRAYIEAESEEEAREKFWDGECFETAQNCGYEIQDSVDVEEVA